MAAITNYVNHRESNLPEPYTVTEDDIKSLDVVNPSHNFVAGDVTLMRQYRCTVQYLIEGTPADVVAEVNGFEVGSGGVLGAPALPGGDLAGGVPLPNLSAPSPSLFLRSEMQMSYDKMQAGKSSAVATYDIVGPRQLLAIDFNTGLFAQPPVWQNVSF